MDILTKCQLCDQEGETPSHLFLNCSFSKEVWAAFMAKTCDVAMLISSHSVMNTDFPGR